MTGVPTLVDKDSTVALLRHGFAAIAALCTDLDGPDWDRPSCLPGWTVRDQVSHVIGVEASLLGEPAPDVDISRVEHLRNPVAEANELWVASMRGLDGARMRSRFAEVIGRRLVALDAMTQDDFDAPSWTPAGRDETYGRFMRIRHYDCFMHEHDIRDALGSPPRTEPDALRFALDEVETGLGYIVGRRAAMPAGTRVQIDLTGPSACTYLVEVGDRAKVVDRFDRGGPTVGLQLPLTLFLRLTGGRHDLHPHRPEDIVVSGDRHLADRLVDSLAFTI